MSLHRIERVNELMQREVANALFRVLSPAEFDPAGVTVTHAITTHDLRQCKVLVSFYGDEEKKKRDWLKARVEERLDPSFRKQKKPPQVFSPNVPKLR